jgi:hypothetical protein
LETPLLDTTLDDDFAELLDTPISLLQELTEELDDNFAELLLEPSEEEDFSELLDVSTNSTSMLLLEFAKEDDFPLNEDLSLLDVSASSFLLLLDKTLDDDFAPLDVMPDSVPASPFLRLLDEDFSLELLEPSQSSQADEDETSSESVAELLSSSQATRTAATKPIVKIFFKNIKITPTKRDKYTQIKLFGPLFCHFEPKISILCPPQFI